MSTPGGIGVYMSSGPSPARVSERPWRGVYHHWDGTPDGLELAYATPRRWLLPGRRIVVRGARTSFGSLSYSLVARKASVRVRLTVPRRVRPAALRLRMRLPVGKRITSVSVGGRAFERFDSGSGTIDLSGLKGRVNLVASYS